MKLESMLHQLGVEATASTTAVPNPPAAAKHMVDQVAATTYVNALLRTL